MAKYSAVKATVNAYIKQNGRKEITGKILNAVLNATIDSLGKFYQFAGEALPTDDPGTPDQNLTYLAGTAGTYTNFGGLTLDTQEIALLMWDGEWKKQTLLFGIQEVDASVDNQVGTPSVDVDFENNVLTLSFHNIKGDKGDTGDPAGFGQVTASVDDTIGNPSVQVQTSGEDTAKNIAFEFHGLRGETGITSVVVSVDNTTGNPACSVSLVGQVLHLDFTGLKGLKGDTGVSADYPITIYNGLDSDATDQALSAAQGNVLDGKIGQLGQDIAQTNRSLSKQLQNIINFSFVQPTLVVGLIPDKGSRTFSSSSSTSYGIAYIPVIAGRTYHVTHSQKTSYPVYIDVSFTKNVPAAGVVIDTLIYNVPAQVSAAIDVLFTPIVDGYLCLLYTTGATYSFSSGNSLKDFYTKTEIQESDAKQIYRTDRVALNMGLSDAKRIYDMSDESLSSMQGWGMSGSTAARFVVSSSPSTATYGLQYLAVQAGKTYAFQATSKTCLSGYTNVAFSRNLPENNVLADTMMLSYKSDTESFDFLFTAIADGYIYLAYFNSETTKWKAKSVSNDSIPYEDNILNIDALVTKSPAPLINSGSGQIGTSRYNGNLGENYIESALIPLNKYQRVVARLQGNNTINVITFFNASKQTISDIWVTGTSSLANYDIDLSQEQYANAKYVRFGAYNASADFSAMYAYLYPKYILDNIQFIPYKKILCIGDSLTNSAPDGVSSKVMKRWVYGVCQYLNIPAFSLGGGAGANVANVGDNTIYARVQALTTDNDVDVITFWGGTNDWGSNITLGDFATNIDSSTRDVTTFYGGLIACVEKLLTLYPTKRIILIGTTPRTWNNGASNAWNTPNAGGKYLWEFVDAVKKVAEYYGLPFLDLLRTSGINANNINQFMYQQTSGGVAYYLHFNEYGASQIAFRIASFIKSAG